jgi:hypothetical protein
VRLALKVISWALWALLTLAYAGWMILGAVEGSLGCEDPVGSSNYGQAGWRWWPPGKTCTYESAELTEVNPPVHVSAHVDRPGVANVVIPAVLIIWLGANVFVYVRAIERLTPVP